MKIYGLQKLSLLDYPEKIAATVFTGGCNLRCPFCHNASIVINSDPSQEISQDEVLSFLEKRRGKLDGVCITGGEPLLQNGLEDFIKCIRQMGFLVKLDTNGCLPDKLRALIDAGLLDFVAMDIKNSPTKYAITVGAPLFDIKPVLESIELLKSGKTDYEFRTTLVKGLHDENDMREISQLLDGADRYFLQNFVDSGDILGFRDGKKALIMEAFSQDELENFHDIVKPHIKITGVRG